MGAANCIISCRMQAEWKMMEETLEVLCIRSFLLTKPASCRTTPRLVRPQKPCREFNIRFGRNQVKKLKIRSQYRVLFDRQRHRQKDDHQKNC